MVRSGANISTLICCPILFTQSFVYKMKHLVLFLESDLVPWAKHVGHFFSVRHQIAAVRSRRSVGSSALGQPQPIAMTTALRAGPEAAEIPTSPSPPTPRSSCFAWNGATQLISKSDGPLLNCPISWEPAIPSRIIFACAINFHHFKSFLCFSLNSRN